MTHKNERVLSGPADGGRYLTGPLARYALSARWLPPLAREAARPAGLGETCDHYDPCISCSAHFLGLTVERSLWEPNGPRYPPPRPTLPRRARRRSW